MPVGSFVDVAVGSSVAVGEDVAVIVGKDVEVGVRVQVAVGVRVGVEVRVPVADGVGWMLTPYTTSVGVTEGRVVGVALGAAAYCPGFCVGGGRWVGVGVKVLLGVLVSTGVAEGCGAMLTGPAVMVKASVAASHSV